ncbi:MAG: hypothetical protein ACFFD4_32475 [Candidatus Odinarchaeota archaeon]
MAKAGDWQELSIRLEKYYKSGTKYLLVVFVMVLVVIIIVTYLFALKANLLLFLLIIAVLLYIEQFLMLLRNRNLLRDEIKKGKRVAGKKKSAKALDGTNKQVTAFCTRIHSMRLFYFGLTLFPK